MSRLPKIPPRSRQTPVDADAGHQLPEPVVERDLLHLCIGAGLCTASVVLMGFVLGWIVRGLL